MITWAKTKGFDNKGLWFNDPLQVDVKDQEPTIKNNEQLVKDLSQFFEEKLK